MEHYVVFETKVAVETENMDEALRLACEALLPLDDVPAVTTNFSHVEDMRGNWKWLTKGEENE